MTRNLDEIKIAGKTYSPDQYVDSDVASQLLGLSRRTIEKLAARRELSVYKFGRANRFLLSELWQWARARRVSPGGCHGDL